MKRFLIIITVFVLVGSISAGDFTITINKSNVQQIIDQTWELNKTEIQTLVRSQANQSGGYVVKLPFRDDPVISLQNGATNEIKFSSKFTALHIEFNPDYWPFNVYADIKLDISGTFYLKPNSNEIGVKNAVAIGSVDGSSSWDDFQIWAADLIFGIGDKLKQSIEIASMPIPLPVYDANIYLSSLILNNNDINIGVNAFIPLGVSISGPSNVSIPPTKATYNTYSWTANVTNSISPTYKWYYVYPSGGSYLLSTNKTYTRLIHWTPSDYNFSLRVDVTDTGGRTASDTKSVSATGGPLLPKTIITQSEQIPEEFVVRTNYPNPFNPTTTIPFDLPENSYVNIEVYNSLGQKVAVLADKEYNAGAYEVIFNATNFSSGIYIVRAQLRSLDTMKSYKFLNKMILMK